PQSGKILAMVNVNGGSCHNSVVSDEFEPGSTFKIVTLASALIEGLNLDEKIDVSGGKIKIYGHTIHDFRDYGILNLKGVFVHSSNVGAVKIGKRIRPGIFFQTARSLGFGNLTGILLPGEAKGKIYRPAEMGRMRYANNCFGQGVTVTLLQLTNSYAAIASGGRLYRPMIVEEIRESKRVYAFKPFLIRRVLNLDICEKIKEVLAAVVDTGTGKLARNEVFKICGKTGTAQKAGVGGYLPDRIITSFCGFFPKDDPQYVVGIMLDEPDVGKWASQITAPIFGTIVASMIRMPDILPEYYVYAR
ncbi:MAG TPA: penicillin-binding protein 2, partial [bacterium (Candidatus Stahlbacteria)]|nr:penicillin-binding protein 2 [Candidatus Stahlbacteria bacterium]